MKLWLLDRHDWGYDQTVACVVIAENEEEARQMAEDEARYDGEEPGKFLDPAESSCDEVRLADGPKVVLEHFHAG